MSVQQPAVQPGQPSQVPPEQQSLHWHEEQQAEAPPAVSGAEASRTRPAVERARNKAFISGPFVAPPHERGGGYCMNQSPNATRARRRNKGTQHATEGLDRPAAESLAGQSTRKRWRRTRHRNAGDGKFRACGQQEIGCRPKGDRKLGQFNTGSAIRDSGSPRRVRCQRALATALGQTRNNWMKVTIIGLSPTEEFRGRIVFAFATADRLER